MWFSIPILKPSILIFEDSEFSDAIFSRLGNDLVVNAYGDSDQVSVKNFFSSESYRYTAFEFSDKTVASAEVMNYAM